MMPRKPRFKIVVLGAMNAGKTSLLRRKRHNQFLADEKATIGAAFVQVEVAGKALELWDTAGQEKYRALTQSYYKGAMCALLVVDCTAPDSLYGPDGVLAWIVEFREATQDAASVVVAINKLDLLANDDRHRPAMRAPELAKLLRATFPRWTIPVVETSAKTGESVAEVFTTIAAHIPELPPDDDTISLETPPPARRSSCACALRGS